ncbi:hypothetical protein EDB87DRAFT_1574105 [Lactarius vividus]|nr:hypothetical protein EDB87DRAFT_1574105 [Lactarius vividus]
MWGRGEDGKVALDSLGKKEDGERPPGPLPHGNEKGLFPQSARAYSATDGDEKTTHFYQENTGFETDRAQIMCLLEEGHEQWTTRILDVMLRLGSALPQPNVSDEGSRGGNAPLRPWTTSKRTIGRDVTARSSRNIGVLYLAMPVHNMQTTGTGQGELAHGTTSFSAGGALVTKQSAYPIWGFSYRAGHGEVTRHVGCTVAGASEALSEVGRFDTRRRHQSLAVGRSVNAQLSAETKGRPSQQNALNYYVTSRLFLRIGNNYVPKVVTVEH